MYTNVLHIVLIRDEAPADEMGLVVEAARLAMTLDKANNAKLKATAGTRTVPPVGTHKLTNTSSMQPSDESGSSGPPVI